MKKLQKSKYEKDSLLLKLIRLTSSKFNDKEKTPTRVDYIKKREIDRSTLYSFDGPFQLIHADLGNLEFLGKNATVQKYVLYWLVFFLQRFMLTPCVAEN